MTNAEWLKQQGDGVVAKARSFSKAMASEAKATLKKEPSVSPEEVEQRLSICADCDRFIKTQKKCSDCGCYMHFKARLRSQHCPQRKW